LLHINARFKYWILMNMLLWLTLYKQEAGMINKLLVILLLSGMLAVSGCDRGQQNAGTTAQPAEQAMEMARPVMPETPPPAMETAEATMEEAAAPAEQVEMGEQSMEGAAETMEMPSEQLEDAAAQAGETIQDVEPLAKEKLKEGMEAVKPALDQ
jgi:hypothetical protein